MVTILQNSYPKSFWGPGTWKIGFPIKFWVGSTSQTSKRIDFQNFCFFTFLVYFGTSLVFSGPGTLKIGFLVKFCIGYTLQIPKRMYFEDCMRLTFFEGFGTFLMFFDTTFHYKLILFGFKTSFWWIKVKKHTDLINYHLLGPPGSRVMIVFVSRKFRKPIGKTAF